jgi:AcrR family transcriptional regulator
VTPEVVRHPRRWRPLSPSRSADPRARPRGATRALFDERGVQDAPIEEIAKAAGIARGLIYRHFSSKEELFFLTVTLYLDELAELLEAATAAEPDPAGQLEALMEAYAAYCLRYPAFLDCSQSLMRQRTRDLRATVSESVWLRLGRAWLAASSRSQGVARGRRSGALRRRGPALHGQRPVDPDARGDAHGPHARRGARARARGCRASSRSTRRLVRTCVASTLATVGAKPPAG